MNNQQAFNKVWDHFIVNKGKKSIDSNESCVYRGPYGRKCAVGVLLPDELYREEFDNGTSKVSGTIKSVMKEKKVAQFFKKVSLGLLIDLQHMHDNDNSWGEKGQLKSRKLREVAKTWDLKVPETSDL